MCIEGRGWFDKEKVVFLLYHLGGGGFGVTEWR